MKKFISLFLALTMVASLFTVTVSAAETLTVTERYEAEEHFIENTVYTSSTIASNTAGDTYLLKSGHKPEATHPFQFSFTAKATGQYSFVLRYGGDDTMSSNTSTVKIGDTVIYSGVVPGTSSWAPKATIDVGTTTLTAGQTYTFTWYMTATAAATVSIDYVDVTYTKEIKSIVDRTERLEAETHYIENGRYSPESQWTSIHTDETYSGGGYLKNGSPDVDIPFQLKYTAEATGAHTFNLGAYSWSKGEVEAIVKIDDTEIYSGALPGSKSDMPAVCSPINLVKGQTYTFTFYQTAADTTFIDYVDVKWTERVMDETTTMQNNVTERIEAETNFIENAAYSASNSVQTNASFSGGGFLRRTGHKPESGWPFQVNFTAKHTGPHTFVLKHGGDGDFGSLSNVVKVGDTQIYTGTLTASGGWSPTVETTVGTTNLTAGQTYTFTWYMTGTGASTVSVDYVDVKWTEEITAVQASTSGSVTERLEESDCTGNSHIYANRAKDDADGYASGGKYYQGSDLSGYPISWSFTAKATGTHSFALRATGDPTLADSIKSTISVDGTAIYNGYINSPGWGTAKLSSTDVGTAELTAGQTYTIKWEIDAAATTFIDCLDVTWDYSDSMYADVALIDTATGEEVYGVDKIQAGTYCAKVYATEWTSSAMAPVLYAAVYDSTGALSDVKTVNVVSGDTVQTSTITVADGDYVMLYMWNDGNLQPLTGHWIFR